MDLERLKPALRRTTRIGKIGFVWTVMIIIGCDMLVHILGGYVDGKALVAAAMPLLAILALLGAGGEILVRILDAPTKPKR